MDEALGAVISRAERDAVMAPVETALTQPGLSS